MFLTIFCWLQYINPTVKNSQHPLKGNYLYALERILKLSIPTLYVWLCMFYCFFHLWYVNKQSFSLLSVLSKCRTKIHHLNLTLFFGTFMHPRLLTSMRGNMQVEYSGRGFAFWGPGILQRLVECKDSWRGKKEFTFLHFLAEKWPFIEYEELDG